MGYVVGITDFSFAMIKKSKGMVYQRRTMSDIICALTVNAKFGDDCRLVTMIKNDGSADRLFRNMKNLNVNTDMVILTNTGCNAVMIYDEEDEPIVYNQQPAYGNLLLTDIQIEQIDHADVCIFSSNMLNCRKSRNTVMSLIRFLKGKGVKIFFDCEYDKNYWEDEQSFADVAYQAIKLADVCHLTMEEFLMITGGEDKEDGFQMLNTMEPEKVVVVSQDNETYVKYEKRFQTIEIPFEYVSRPNCSRGAMTGGMLHKYVQLADRITPVMWEDYVEMVEFGIMVRNSNAQNGGEIYSVPSFEQMIDML